MNNLPRIRIGVLTVLLVASTLLVRGNYAAAANTVELNVTPIAQRFSPAVNHDSGLWDCLPASVFMALQTLQQQQKFGGEPLTYERVRSVYRAGKTGSVPLAWEPTPALVATLTGNAVVATVEYAPTTPATKWQDWLAGKLQSGSPVVAHINNWLLLSPPGHPTAEAGIKAAEAHAITISGLHDGQVFYNDPWDGKHYGLPEAEFATAWGQTWAAITFQVNQQASPTQTTTATPTASPSPSPSPSPTPTVAPTASTPSSSSGSVPQPPIQDPAVDPSMPWCNAHPGVGCLSTVLPKYPSVSNALGDSTVPVAIDAAASVYINSVRTLRLDTEVSGIAGNGCYSGQAKQDLDKQIQLLQSNKQYIVAKLLEIIPIAATTPRINGDTHNPQGDATVHTTEHWIATTYSTSGTVISQDDSWSDNQYHFMWYGHGWCIDNDVTKSVAGPSQGATAPPASPGCSDLVCAIRAYVVAHGQNYLGDCSSLDPRTVQSGWCSAIQLQQGDTAQVLVGIPFHDSGTRITYTRTNAQWQQASECHAAASGIGDTCSSGAPSGGQPRNTDPVPHASQAASISTDKAQYRVGDAITVCYHLPGPGTIAITAHSSDGSTSRFYSVDDDGTGDCIKSTMGPPLGRECLQLQYSGVRGNGITETCYQIIR